MRTGDWGTLYLAGQPFFDKPPLVVWMTALSFELFGISTWAARLPAVACSVGCCLVTARLGERIAGPTVGLLAGFLLAATPGFVRFGSTLLLDPPFVLAGLVGLLATLGAWQRGGRGLWLTGAWFGVAFLAKGPQTLALPAILVGAWLVSPAGERPPFRTLVAAGVAFIAVVLPWHLYELARWGGAFVAGAVGDVTEKLEGRPPLWTYVRATATSTLPWLPLAILGMWRTARARRPAFPVRLLATWTAVAWGMLLFSGKYSPRYLMLVDPALAVWAALPIARRLPESPRLARPAWGLAAIAWLVALAWPATFHPTGVRDAVVALAPAVGSGPVPLEGFRLGHEGTRARFAFYLDRDVHSTYEPDRLALLPEDTPVVTAERDAGVLVADDRFVEARRSRDFVVFRLHHPPGAIR